MGLFSKSRNNTPANDATHVPEWLKKLQENSWELEILISGGAIFSLFQLSDWTVDFYKQLTFGTVIVGRNVLFTCLMLAIKALTLGFTAHIIVRSFWISLIALSSIFTDARVRSEKKLAAPYKVRSTDVNQLIVKVDKLAGWLMYNSFTLVLIIMGWLILIFSVLMVAINLIHFLPPIVEKVLMGLLFIYFLDFIFFGFLRKIPFVAYITYPVFKVFDTLSLRFIYQPGLDLVTSHVAKWKIFAYYTCFVTISLLFTYMSVYRILHWHNIFEGRKYRFALAKYDEVYSESFYRDKGAKPKFVSIQSDIVVDPVLNLFVHYGAMFDGQIDRIKNPDERYFENILEVTVDDSLCNGLVYYSVYGETAAQTGITTYVDVSHFAQGPHNLKVVNKYATEEDLQQVKIPFWLSKQY